MIIGIDPGHGGSDPGCVCENFIEKDWTLEIALMIVETCLKLSNVEVALTRAVDKKCTLSQRRHSMVYDAQADFVFSIHVDACQSQADEGMCIYRQFGAYKAEDVAISVLNGYAKKESYYVNETGMVKPRKSPISVCCSERPWTLRALNVLKGYDPSKAILIECGYSTNKRDRDWLMSSVGKSAVVDAVECGIMKLKDLYSLQA
jgi:N-acetylmuramoyl-L-alanine amidase